LRDASSEAPGLFLEPENPDYTVEYVHKITYLESRVRILKQQVIVAMDQAKRSSTLSRNVSSLEDQVFVLKSKITQLEDGKKYMTEILERAGEQLKCKFLRAPSIFPAEIYV
jgi:hypothetical protein